MIPKARTVHQTEGRLRVRIPSMKGDVPYFTLIGEKLAACPAMKSITVNPLIGTVLLVHEATPREIARYAQEHRLFSLRHERLPHKSLFDSTADVFRQLDSRLKKATGGDIDVTSLVFLFLVVSGIYQIMKGNVQAPAWYTAFWYALGIFSRGAVDDWDENADLVTDFGDGD